MGDFPVLMLYGSLLEEGVYPLIEKTYKILSEKYKNVHLLKLPGDNSAIAHHSYVTCHKKMAEILIQEITKLI